MKARRQSAILDVVEHEAVRNQEQLRQRLAARGFAVTQATLSRDIKELGLMKRSADGAYQPSSIDHTPQTTALSALARALSEYLVTPRARAAADRVADRPRPSLQLLGLAIDQARLSEVVAPWRATTRSDHRARSEECARSSQASEPLRMNKGV